MVRIPGFHCHDLDSVCGMKQISHNLHSKKSEVV